MFTSPGGYILGEETALLECMEGHRGEPRNKPPFPGNYGLHGRPTLINSVETLADVPVVYEYVGQTAGSREVEVRARVNGILQKRNFAEGGAVKTAPFDTE